MARVWRVIVKLKHVVSGQDRVFGCCFMRVFFRTSGCFYRFVFFCWFNFACSGSDGLRRVRRLKQMWRKAYQRHLEQRFLVLCVARLVVSFHYGSVIQVAVIVSMIGSMIKKYTKERMNKTSLSTLCVPTIIFFVGDGSGKCLCSLMRGTATRERTRTKSPQRFQNAELTIRSTRTELFTDMVICGDVIWINYVGCLRMNLNYTGVIGR